MIYTYNKDGMPFATSEANKLGAQDGDQFSGLSHAEYSGIRKIYNITLSLKLSSGGST